MTSPAFVGSLPYRFDMGSAMIETEGQGAQV